jgi:hypothetical protein
VFYWFGINIIKIGTYVEYVDEYLEIRDGVGEL